MATVERRRDPRVQTDLPLKLTFQDETVTTEIHNISGSGIRFSSPAPLQPLSRVQIALELPAPEAGERSSMLAITGVVVRCQAEPGEGDTPFDTAIYFEDLSENARKQLSRFVSGILG